MNALNFNIDSLTNPTSWFLSDYIETTSTQMFAESLRKPPVEIQSGHYHLETGCINKNIRVAR